MKISVLVPSEEYRSYAGARIRYGRMHAPLAEIGVDLQFEKVGEFTPDRANCDVLLISKCHDARSLIAASALSERGCLVGVDVFDDYFSQRADSRLVRFRSWLRQLLPICDFALCSTPSIAELLTCYRDGLPVHVTPDPAEHLALPPLSLLLARKMARVLDAQKIRLAWFGVGDNPHFQVGLADLAAFGGTLAPLHRSGYEIELTALTNARALDADGLSLIGQLPVRTTVKEWTEERERELLADTFACFLPVNSQAFSTAKSLNRAVTALSAGCQVISAGYPLYESLGDFIYRDVEDFLADLGRGRMRLSADALDGYGHAIERHASPSREALALARFLGSLAPSLKARVAPLALVHGRVTTDAAHALVHSLGGFSVASPYCDANLAFDVVFRGDPGRLAMFVSERSTGRLRPKACDRLQSSDKISGQRFWEFRSAVEAAAGSGVERGASDEVPLSSQLAKYRSVIESIGAQMEDAFGPCRLLVSENSHIPFQPTVAATRC